MKNGFEKRYPYLHLYVNYQGWLVIGPDEYFNSWVRILDQGGMHLELDEKTLDASLDKAEAWATEWMTKHYAEEVKAMLAKKT
jgi:hypothetical protein